MLEKIDPKTKQYIAGLIGAVLGISGTVAISTPEYTSIEDVVAVQEQYFADHGKYLQVMPKNVLPEYEAGTVKSKLGKKIPDNMSVNVYDGPKGKGFYIVYDGPTVTYSIGFGPHAEDFNRSIIKPFEDTSASSTPQ